MVVEKEYQDGSKGVKARSVVRGFEEEKIFQVDASTASKATLRSSLTIAANENWQVETVDVKGALLQGNKIERKVNLEPPDDVKVEGKIWRIRKTAYGLCDVACVWYLSLTDELLKLACKQSEIGNLKLFLLFMWMIFFVAGTSHFRQEVIEKLTMTFKTGCRQTGNFRYVGLEIQHGANGIRM